MASDGLVHNETSSLLIDCSFHFFLNTLAVQLKEVVDDRTLDRFLNRSGLRQAEAAGCVGK